MSALSDEQVALGLFAEAIAAQPVTFEVAEVAAECWPFRLSHRLDQPGQDQQGQDQQGKDQQGQDQRVVHLPPTLDRTAYRVMVLHQILRRVHAGGGDVNGDGSVAPIQFPSRLFNQVLALVEDVRVAAQIRHHYPGAVIDLEALLAQARLAEPTTHPADTAAQDLIAVLRQVSLAVEPLGDGRGRHVDYNAVLAELAAVETSAATDRTSRRVAARLCSLIAGELSAARAPLAELAPEDASDEPGIAGDEATGASLEATGSPSEFEQSENLVGGQPGADALEQAQSIAGDDVEERATFGIELPTVRSTAPKRERTFLYDEWDYRAQQHRQAWCTVREEKLYGEDHDFITDVRQRHSALRSRIRRTFAQLRPSELVRVYRSDDGDELDIDAAIEAVIDRRSGAPADDRLHIRRDRAARDVATAFLVDLSASTSSPAVPPEPEPPQGDSPRPDQDPFDDPMSYGPIWGDPPKSEPMRRVIDVAKDAVALMCDALHELGDQHAVYGFSGTGRDNVEFTVSKDFADRSSPQTWAAIAEMKPLRYTRMGPAIRHASSKLAAQSSRTKLLIVISDGYPQDVDYGEDRRDRDYGVHDTGRALADATALGIDTFCVTIDPAGHDYLREMCPDERYLVIDEVESLPEELARLYLGLSRS